MEGRGWCPAVGSAQTQLGAAGEPDQTSWSSLARSDQLEHSEQQPLRPRARPKQDQPGSSLIRSDQPGRGAARPAGPARPA
eukprot:3381196-Prymnesium_polylepis.1